MNSQFELDQDDSNRNEPALSIWSMSRNAILDTSQLAALRIPGFSGSRAAKLRVTGDGPPYTKCGSRVSYVVGDIQDYLRSKQRQSTSEDQGRKGPETVEEAV